MAIIEVDGLVKGFGDTPVLRGVTFAVEPGEIFGILGPNGAGKSTTVDCVTGLRRRDGGTVRVLGVDPERDRNTIRRQVGVQLQETSLPAQLTVREALELFASFYDEPADVAALVDDLGLGPVLRTAFKHLSGGQRQRLSIALALVGNPVLAVLDELTTGLDPAARRDTWRLIEQVRDRGVTVLLVTHFMQEAEHLCDRLAVIDAGVVTALGTPADLTARISAPQALRFVPSRQLADGELLALPGVTDVRRHGDELVVTGDGDALGTVTAHLARAGILAHNLRVEQATLEDAFVALTGGAR